VILFMGLEDHSDAEIQLLSDRLLARRSRYASRSSR
jgi:hypothetical protein